MNQRIHKPKNPPIEPRLLTIDDLVHYTGVAKQTIYNSRNPKSRNNFPIEGKKIGGRLLWDKRQVDAYLDKLFAKEEARKAVAA